MRRARGSTEGRRNFRRIVVGFDPETFQQIGDLAAEAGLTFSEQVRELVEWGLQDAEDPRP